MVTASEVSAVVEVALSDSEVVWASAAAAAANAEEAEESMIQYGSQTPAAEQREIANEVAATTSEP